MDCTSGRTRSILTAIVYGTLLLDNILLTVIVPILPDFLQSINNKTASTATQKNYELNYSINKHPFASNTERNATVVTLSKPSSDYNFETENGSVGILLAVKAFVQFFSNPIVGNLSLKYGYKNIIFFGTFNLLLSSIIFTFGGSFLMFFIARAIEGIGSACINVCGMSLIAQMYPEDNQRSKIMGVILGSIALGVLFGYPLGGVLYDFVSESAPFILIAFFLFTDLGFQLTFFNLSRNECELSIEEKSQKGEPAAPQWVHLLCNKLVFTIALAIFLSTSAMAVLEPLLPIWLMAHLHPKKWQLGTVFIPDSLGYFVGTNFFGAFAFRFGQVKTSVIAIMVVGLSCFFIPEARSVANLIVPHFLLGLGIGILDASLVPYLARLADAITQNYDEFQQNEEIPMTYGSVYAIQQTAVSLAYSVVPFLGGEFAQSLGFPAIMRFLGVLNFLYGPVLLYVTAKQNIMMSPTAKQPDLLLKDTNPSNYRRLYESID